MLAGLVHGQTNALVLSSLTTGSAKCATPVLKMRSCVEHDLHQPRTQRRVRMVISGRMADVCAELERLAALENHRNATVLH